MPKKIKKEFEHNKIEPCKMSKKPIDTSVEQYCILLDCRGEEIFSAGFYKPELLKDLFKGNTEKIVKEMLNKQGKLARAILEKVGLVQKVVNV